MIEYSPLDYIKIDIANQFGLDKIQFEDRIKWVDTNINKLSSMTKQADKPAQYVAAILCLRDAMNGEPSGHLIGLDACASGIAIMGVVYGCPITCANVGVTGDTRKDFYTILTKQLNTHLTNDIEIPRTLVKKAVMTSFYGSTATPKRLLGEDTPELEAFYTTREEVAPGACEVMTALLDSWQDTDYHCWEMPDKFVVRKPTIQQTTGFIEIDELDHLTMKYTYDKIQGNEFGLAIAADITHSIDGFIVREMNRRCHYGEAVDNYLKLPYSPSKQPLYKKHTFISMALIEDAEYRTEELDTLVARVMEYKSFEILAIHDEFKCLPNNVNRMRYWYMEILVELNQSNILQTILTMVNNDEITVDKIADLSDEIRQGNYHLS